MSEERFEQDEAKDEKDVEAHRRVNAANDEPKTDDDESDDVEAHRRVNL